MHKCTKANSFICENLLDSKHDSDADEIDLSIEVNVKQFEI